MPTPMVNQSAQIDAWGKQYDAQQEQEAEQQKPNAAEVLPSSVFHWMNGNSLGRTTLSGIDSAVSTAENMYNSVPAKPSRDIAAGATTGAVNTVDAVKSGVNAVAGIAADSKADPGLAAMGNAAQMVLGAANPIWDHAKQHILDFRDAVAVKDPTIADSLTQSVAQLAVPFAGYSRMLGGMGNLAKNVVAGAITDSTALAPHDMRTADLIALGQHTEGKFGEVLRAMGPYGLNAYVNYLTDRTNETEAQGRFKNALDGLGANAVLTPLMHAVGITLKQGLTATRYLAANGVRNTISDLAAPMKTPGMPAGQAGKIVFHGTASDFDQFDASKIGSGEGNQVYGHGLYFAEDPNVAGHYRQMLAQRTVAGNDSPMRLAQSVLEADGVKGSRPGAVEELNRRMANAKDPNFRSRAQQAIDLVKSGAASQRGTLMHVDIPDEKLNQMLDWDAPLSHQTLPEAVASKVSGLSQYNNVRGADAYHELANQMGAKEASTFLHENGVPGIRYLDGTSRGSGQGSRNIVLFDAKHAQIVRKEK